MIVKVFSLDSDKIITCLWLLKVKSKCHLHMGQFLQGGKNPCFVSLFFYGEPSCGQTMQNKIDFSIDFGWLGIVHSKNVLTYLQKNFWSPVQHPFFSPIDYFLGKNEVRIKPSCDHTLTAGPNLMCPSSWALNSDNFPFFFNWWLP